MPNNLEWKKLHEKCKRLLEAKMKPKKLYKEIWLKLRRSNQDNLKQNYSKWHKLLKSPKESSNLFSRAKASDAQVPNTVR